MKSYAEMQEIKNKLSEMAVNMEANYFRLRQECISEVLEMKNEVEHKRNELSEFYEELSVSPKMQMEWVKKKLPWYITLFHRIKVTEISLVGLRVYMGIVMGGNSTQATCFVKITAEDIRK